MSGRRKNTNKWAWLWAFPVILLLIAGASIVSAVFADREVAVIESSPGVAEATVVGVETHYGRRGRRSYEPTVQFVAANGVTVTVELPRYRNKGFYEVGDVVTVRYATSDPDFCYDVRLPPDPARSWIIGWVSLALGLSTVAPAIVLTRRESRRKAHGLSDS